MRPTSSVFLLVGALLSGCDGSARGVESAALNHPETKLCAESLRLRFGARADGAVVTSFQSVAWPSGALGFPKPGMVYTQALVPGHLIIFRLASGDTAACHSSADRAVLD